MTLSREALTAACGIRSGKVEVKGLGPLSVRELSADQYLRIGQLAASKGSRAALSALVVTMGVLKESGEPMFEEAEAEDLAKSWGMKKLQSISDAILEFSGLTEKKD